MEARLNQNSSLVFREQIPTHLLYWIGMSDARMGPDVIFALGLNKKRRKERILQLCH